MHVEHALLGGMGRPHKKARGQEGNAYPVKKLRGGWLWVSNLIIVFIGTTNEII
jgi:hypothetical protein